jgi:hypothetical protein
MAEKPVPTSSVWWDIGRDRCLLAGPRHSLRTIRTIIPASPGVSGRVEAGSGIGEETVFLAAAVSIELRTLRWSALLASC